MRVTARTRVLAVFAAGVVLLSAGGGHVGAAVGLTRVGPPVPGDVIRVFEAPDRPYGPGHRGVDLAAAPGEAVVAPLAGTVHFAGQVAGVRWVTLDHGGGLRTTYGPVQTALRRGSGVARGAQLGSLEPEATHLDWGVVLDESYIDPLTLLVRWLPHLVAH